MRPVNEIAFGFLLFFIIERCTRLCGNMVFEPTIKNWTQDKDIIENCRITLELIVLLIIGFCFYTKA